MGRPSSVSKYWILAATVVVAGAIVWWSQNGAGNAPTVSVKVPSSFSSDAKVGRNLFEANCMACHGKNAGGTKSAPPLVHKIYNPNHHADFSFRLAVKRGVRKHHWRFGNMPPVADVTDAQVTLITRYVRELQRANGIQ
ncbi:MAG: c-type cytochrome [Geminicoccales bacterium]